MCQELVDHAPRDTGRNRETEIVGADEPARIDADDLAILGDQRSAGCCPVDRRVGLQPGIEGAGLVAADSFTVLKYRRLLEMMPRVTVRVSRRACQPQRLSRREKARLSPPNVAGWKVSPRRRSSSRVRCGSAQDRSNGPTDELRADTLQTGA